jgi:GNAT superfamily N-acetyltransferase
MPAAARVHRAAFDERLPWLVGLHTPDEDQDFWSGTLFCSCTVCGAETAQGLVGVIAYRDEWIEQLHVLPEAQGQGIGSALLEIAKTASPRLNLWTFQRNTAARRFYERRGFSIVEETDGAGNQEQEPDVLYNWLRETR